MTEITKPAGNQQSNSQEKASDSQDVALKEGMDYYIDQGLMVLTAAFLQKRGYCCESGCRHCPYGYTRRDL